MVIKDTSSAMVLNKPPGLATQGGSKTTKHVDGLLDSFVEDDEVPRPRLVHRLDKDILAYFLLLVLQEVQQATQSDSLEGVLKKFIGPS